MSFEREVMLFFPAKQFTTDGEEHLRNLVALERWAESGRDFMALLNKDALPDATDFGLGTLLVENEILKIRKAAGWKTIVDEDSLVGSLPANVAYTDVDNIFTVRQTMQGAAGLTNSFRVKNTTATPPADTLIGSFDFLGKDDAGNDTAYAGVNGYVTDDTDTSEDGYGILKAQIGAAYAEILRWGGVSGVPGIHIGGAMSLSKLAADELLLDTAALTVWRAAEGSPALNFRKSADSVNRFRAYLDGKMEWGSGAAAADTNLYRDVASRLKTDDMLNVVDGVATKTKAGALVDGDFTAAAIDGLLGVDTTNHKLMFRSGAAWKTLDPAAGGDPYTEITKGADQDVTNNAALQNDTALTFAVAAGDLIHLLFFIIYSGNNATGDYKWGFAFPASTIAMGEVRKWSTADAYVTGDVATAIGGAASWPSAAAQNENGTDAAHTKRLMQGEVTLLVANAGNVTYQFANVSAAGGRTSRTHAGSTIRYRKLN